jgi:hypothetical protein
MKKIFFLFLLSLFHSINSQVFKEPYYFIGPDEMHVYKQSHDTLYTSTTFSLQSTNIKKYKSHYKIWDVIEKSTDYIVLKLENLDSIPLTTEPYPEDRFRISFYKKKNKNELLLLRDISHLTKEAMINYNIDSIQLENNFGMSLYSLSYMKELLRLKKVKTKNDAEEINNELKDSRYLTMVENYKIQNKLLDPYASILAATLINTACLKLGYSPIGASVLMNIINSDKKPKEKEKIIDEFYKRINP